MEDRYLFKAKRIDNGEWITGYLLVKKKDFYICEKSYECMDEYSSLNGQSYGFGGFKFVDPSTIRQCTAVPDRDKKIMYENDVVRASGGVRGVIRFGRYGDEKNDYGFYVEWEKSQPYWRSDIYYWQSELRVIGSYIDNPELLEVGE